MNPEARRPPRHHRADTPSTDRAWRRRVQAALLSLPLLAALPAQAIEGGIATTAFGSVGVGVQITADWVLTVNHAALDVGGTYVNAYGERTVAARYDAPGAALGFPSDDLSLLRLVSADTAAPTVAVEATWLPDADTYSLAATLVSAANQGGSRGYAYTGIDSVTSLLDPDDGGPQGEVSVNWLISLDSAVHVQSGDSGGGLFVGSLLDTGVLWGLSSALLTNEADQPIGSAFVQLAAYRSWIDQVMASDLADNDSVLWVNSLPVPEPATWALWLAGVAGLGAWARRRPGGAVG